LKVSVPRSNASRTVIVIECLSGAGQTDSFRKPVVTVGDQEKQLLRVIVRRPLLRVHECLLLVRATLDTEAPMPTVRRIEHPHWLSGLFLLCASSLPNNTEKSPREKCPFSGSQVVAFPTSEAQHCSFSATSSSSGSSFPYRAASMAGRRAQGWAIEIKTKTWYSLGKVL